MATYHIIRHLLFKLDPERAHHVTFTGVRYLPTFVLHMLEEALAFEDERLKQEIWGMTFTDRALINRMGLNNEGADAISKRLSKKPPAFRIPLGINIAKTHDPNILGSSAIEDFRYSFRRLASLADYIALNISCPNTAEGKTFEVPEALEALLRVISTERQTLQLSVPILIKFSPPAPNTSLTVYTPLIKIALEQGIDGLPIQPLTAPMYRPLKRNYNRSDPVGSVVLPCVKEQQNSPDILTCLNAMASPISQKL